MKRVISMILILVIFASIIPGLAVSVSAATNDWSVYSEHCYYDAKNKTDYHVVFSFKESSKTRLGVVKDNYISQMKVDTYVTVRSGNKATVTKKTGVLKQNSKTTIDSCLDYLKKYYPSLYASYKEVLHEQENYRVVYIHKMSGSKSSIMSKWSNYAIQKYINKYKQYVRDGFKGSVEDAIAKAIGFELPAPLALLGSVSSVNDDYGELKELCEDVIGSLYNAVELYWLDCFCDSGELANGTSLVKKLLNEANTHTTSTKVIKKSLDSQSRIKLAPGIYVFFKF